MNLYKTSTTFPFSAAVSYQGRILEAVLTGIPRHADCPVSGGVTGELAEIFRQLDEILNLVELEKCNICSVRLYLQQVNRDINAANEVYREYFGGHAPNRRAYGVELQCGMLIEAAFVVEFPDS